jgi:hypothetical protein
MTFAKVWLYNTAWEQVSPNIWYQKRKINCAKSWGLHWWFWVLLDGHWVYWCLHSFFLLFEQLSYLSIFTHRQVPSNPVNNRNTRKDWSIVLFCASLLNLGLCFLCCWFQVGLTFYDFVRCISKITGWLVQIVMFLSLSLSHTHTHTRVCTYTGLNPGLWAHWAIILPTELYPS